MAKKVLIAVGELAVIVAIVCAFVFLLQYAGMAECIGMDGV